jgi:hypothetical protein
MPNTFETRVEFTAISPAYVEPKNRMSSRGRSRPSAAVASSTTSPARPAVRTPLAKECRR